MHLLEAATSSSTTITIIYSGVLILERMVIEKIPLFFI
jgi:hypothetical protein